jgi:hypothetical protein
MADGIFGTLVANMSRLGFFQFLFPFLLALAIVYGLLNFALAKQLPKSARALISLIVAFFVMLYSSWNVMIVNFFAQLSGTWLIVATGLIFIVLLLAIAGFNVQEFLGDKKWGKWVLVLLLVAIGIILFFGAGAGYLINVPGVVFSSDLWTILFFVIILAVVLYFLGTEGEKKEAGGKPAT